MDAWRLDIGECATALRGGRLSAAALLEHCLERIARIDPALNSFVHLDAAAARAAARDSDARLRAGQPRSMLDGIPLSVKDNILVAGMPATWGSRAFENFVPDRDELPVARLRAAGAVILGKTNVPELTLEGYTANALYGVTRNPWNAALTPGGSSGGAASGVAAGLVPAALGTDGGGSIRRPASHTGLVGFKPSTGRVPRRDGFPAILTDFETTGTLTTSVSDAMLLDAVLAGADPRDRRSPYRAAAPWLGERRRILFVPRFAESPVDPEVAAATQAVADALADAGHAVTLGPAFFDLQAAARAWFVISRAGVAWLAARHDLRQAGDTARGMAADGQRLSGADYFDALDKVAALRLACAAAFADSDLILTPTAAALPWPAAEAFPTEIDGRPAGPRDHAAFTGWANMAGHPAISLPVALSRGGLPIGVQFAAGFGADDDLLAFAAGFMARHPAPALPEL